MRRDALLLTFALLATGCASVTPSPGPGMHLGYTPHGDTGAGRAQVSSPPSSPPEPEESPRLHRRRGARQDATRVGLGHLAVTVGGERQGATTARLAVLAALRDVRESSDGLSRALVKLAARTSGIGGANGVFTRYVTHGAEQLRWVGGTLAGTATLVNVASEVGDEDMKLGLLRMTGPRLQAALSGALLLSAWVDFLHLADAVLQHCPAYGVETLFLDMDRVQRLMRPSLAALASREPDRVEAAATAMPALMGQLTREFTSIREGARMAMERSGQAIAAAQLVEMLTLMSTLKLSLPRPPPSAPAVLGVGLVMGSGGVIAGSRLVVSAEWVEMMRELVRAGVLSLPAVSAAVRIHAGQVMMAQAQGDLPQGVRDALGDGPEVRAMREAGRAGAGMAEAPKHHVLPQEHRKWFEQRGFTGDMDIDQFCVRLEQAHHEAIHGGGDWHLGRTWPGEWNRMIVEALQRAERRAGRMLTRNEVLDIVAERMKDYSIPLNFIAWRSR